MKRALYTSTALAAAGLITLGAQGASAQSAAPAPAQKMQISIGGFMFQTIGYANNSGSQITTVSASGATSSTGGASRKHFDEKGDSEIYFRGSVNLDNGLTVSLDVEMEADIDASSTNSSNTGTQNSQIDESYMTIGSADVGTLYLGATNAAAFYLGVAAPWSGLNFFDGTLGSWIVSPSTSNASSTTNRAPSAGSTTYNGSFDYNRIEYISPSFAGLRVGGGYAPSSNSSQVQPNVTEINDTNAAVQWAPTFIQGVKPRVYGGWWRRNGSSTTTTDTYSAGADVNVADFIIGGGFATIRHRGNVFDATTGQPDGHAFNAGIKYAPGPFSVALTYAHSTAEDTDAISNNDTHDRVALGADYIIGPGVTLVGELQGESYKDEAGAGNTSNHGWAAITGIKLDF